jgi:hypothetical protein
VIAAQRVPLSLSLNDAAVVAALPWSEQEKGVLADRSSVSRECRRIGLIRQSNGQMKRRVPSG